MSGSPYRCVATTLEGFVQQLAVSYMPHGYWFYVTGRVPERKDPLSVDQKLLKRYLVDVSKGKRARRKKHGFANTHYLRHERFFVLVATHGVGRFFDEEPFRDLRRKPLVYRGYSISFRGGHSSVRIERGAYMEHKARLEELALRRSVEDLTVEFRSLPFEPYAPIRSQLFSMLRAVNRRRQAAGYELVPWNSLRLRRRIVRPFEVPLGAL